MCLNGIPERYYIFRLEDCRLQYTDPNEIYEFKRDILLIVFNVQMSS